MADLEATGKGRNIKRRTIAGPRETDIILNRSRHLCWIKGILDEIGYFRIADTKRFYFESAKAPVQVA